MKKYVVVAMISTLVLGLVVSGMAQRGKNRAQKRGARFFQTMDANKDGKVSKEEWDAHHSKMFKDTDKNKDGFIDETELREHHRKMMEERRGEMMDMHKGMMDE